MTAAEKCRDRAEKYRDRKPDAHWISSLWSLEASEKADKAMMEFAMCVAARKRMKSDTIIKKIVSGWLSMLNLKHNDSALDIEVKKFVKLDEHSMLSYIIGHRLIGKVVILLSFVTTMIITLQRTWSLCVFY